MKAKVTTAFPGRRDNSGASETFPVDAIIEGDLAQVAVDNGWAAEISDETGDTVSSEDKLIKAQAAVDASQSAFETAKDVWEKSDEAGKPAAQSKLEAAEKKLTAAQSKLEKLTKV